MGLDVYPLGKAKPGHKKEWKLLMQALHEEREQSDEEVARLGEISIAPCEALDAPRVGEDEVADAWMLERKDPDSELTDEEFLRRNAGYRVLELLRPECDGVPRYTNSVWNDALDATSFRAQFLENCEGLLRNDLHYEAWIPVMKPKKAVKFGRKLLASAENPWVALPPPPPPPPRRPGFLARLFGRKQAEPDYTIVPDSPPTEEELEEMRNLLRAAGRWYIFWGERGYHIYAWS